MTTRRLYQPLLRRRPLPERRTTCRHAIFPRDPRTGVQVWSGDTGYPGDGDYLDFHKKRWPGGHRYWRVTGRRVDMGDKQPYYPAAGRANASRSHASHFVHLVWRGARDQLQRRRFPRSSALPSTPSSSATGGSRVPLARSRRPQAARLQQRSVQLISCAEYLDAISPRRLSSPCTRAPGAPRATTRSG